MRSGIRPLVVGNWKMNGLCASLQNIEDIAEHIRKTNCQIDVVVCPPATLTYEASRLSKKSSLMIGAQDCHSAESGAHTGDISANMFSDCGASFVILGHSERRISYQETNQIIQSKVKSAYKAGLVTIVCIGETAEEYRSGRTIEFLHKQLEFSLPSEFNPENCVVAYEPIWAIGTGKIPSVSDLEKVYSFVYRFLSDRFPGQGSKIRLLYGGSVSTSNVKEFLCVDYIDGILVGGASLQSEVFLKIIENFERTYVDSYL
ncbi:MAG: triose-phosphate isomerase [Candidatus Liberibacter ctenarytainae]|uniref:Triosephosphate isomerase n=1 Tax=Candidatus Liberibacter ctenarytainae TaxID=2020335 RepID=A0A937DM40_9HYPH|nr:triose-phosphate isomerase [Candidatus Liberibacter ctenarytainae]